VGGRCRLGGGGGHEGHVVEGVRGRRGLGRRGGRKRSSSKSAASGGFAAIVRRLAAKVYSARPPSWTTFQGGRWRGDFSDAIGEALGERDHVLGMQRA